jgi:iron complex transport system substrate-binding protein
MALAFALTLAPAYARTVTDLVGRNVEVPDNVERVACLEIQCYSAMHILGADDRIVIMGALDSPWEEAVNPRFHLIPKYNGDFDVEELLRQKVDVAFLVYNTTQSIARLNAVGIPNLVAQPEAKGIYKNRFQSAAQYAEAAKRMVTMFGEVLGGDAEKNAAAWARYFDDRVRFVNSRLRGISPEKKRKLLYMYSPSPTLGNSNNGYWLGAMAGGKMPNRRSAILGGMQSLAIEDIIAWDPEVIVLGKRYPVSRLLKDPRWQTVSAVRHKQLFQSATDSVGGPGSDILTVLFIATKLYPERFADYDFKAEVRSYYKKFYHCQLSIREIERIMNLLPPEKKQ